MATPEYTSDAREIPEHSKPAPYALFVLSDMMSEIRELNTFQGWRGSTTLAEYVALLHSEVSEILEEWRNGNMQEMYLEFADVLIRLLDMADVFDIDLPLAYREKMDKNWKRAYQHGGKTLLCHAPIRKRRRPGLGGSSRVSTRRMKLALIPATKSTNTPIATGKCSLSVNAALSSAGSRRQCKSILASQSMSTCVL